MNIPPLFQKADRDQLRPRHHLEPPCCYKDDQTTFLAFGWKCDSYTWEPIWTSSLVNRNYDDPALFTSLPKSCWRETKRLWGETASVKMQKNRYRWSLWKRTQYPVPTGFPFVRSIDSWSLIEPSFCFSLLTAILSTGIDLRDIITWGSDGTKIPGGLPKWLVGSWDWRRWRLFGSPLVGHSGGVRSKKETVQQLGPVTWSDGTSHQPFL